MDLSLAKVVAEALCKSGPTPAGVAGHDVQFYRTDEYLTKAVVSFLADGLRAGQPIIVVADYVVGALALGMLLLLVGRFARNLYVLARMEPQRFER
jgi:hypothetical protein